MGSRIEELKQAWRHAKDHDVFSTIIPIHLAAGKILTEEKSIVDAIDRVNCHITTDKISLVFRNDPYWSDVKKIILDAYVWDMILE